MWDKNTGTAINYEKERGGRGEVDNILERKHGGGRKKLEDNGWDPEHPGPIVVESKIVLMSITSKKLK